MVVGQLNWSIGRRWKREVKGGWAEYEIYRMHIP